MTVPQRDKCPLCGARILYDKHQDMNSCISDMCGWFE